MQRVTSPQAMQKLALQWREKGFRIGFVPTMGYLHEGHLSLVDRARSAVGRQGKVVVSIYVNPTQFGPKEDLSKYPRDLKRDLALCKERGVDVTFIPVDGQMYPSRTESSSGTAVVERSLTMGLEGSSRPTHFEGVTTVVTKLFNLVQPHLAVFGAKDYQQSAVIRRMVRDLFLPVRILVAPTVREKDGLAMSSRNSYLTPAERIHAVALWQALQKAKRLVRKGPAKTSKLIQELKEDIEVNGQAAVDYISVFHPETLEPLSLAKRGDHLALAVFLGRTRLIDNVRL